MTTDSDALLPKVMDLLLDAVCVVDVEGRFVFVSAACERIFGYTPDELIGRNMIELVFPEDRKRTLEAAADIMRGHPKMHFENRYVRKDGRIVDIMWSACWSEADHIRLAVARDITGLKRAARMQRALYQISEAAHAANGLFPLYEHIHQIIGELLPAENFFVALYDKRTGMLSFPYFVDGENGLAPQARPLVPGTPIAEVIRIGHSLLMTVRGTGAYGTPVDSTEKHSYADWLGVPLISQKGIIGALVVQSYAAGVRYTNEDKELLEFVSTQIASAIERKQTEARVFHLAHHDALTDLPNRTLFHDRMDMALKWARRKGEHLALLYLDLDEFKEVNDCFGHQAGDQLLREVAGRLARCVRESDTIGRMGGDEFTVLVTNIHGPECVGVIIDKIQAAVSIPFQIGGEAVTVSASIGTAIYPEEGESKEQLFRHADADMYATKRYDD